MVRLVKIPMIQIIDPANASKATEADLAISKKTKGLDADGMRLLKFVFIEMTLQLLTRNNLGQAGTLYG